MNVLEAIKARQSIRVYQNREVEKEKLEIILSAANQAPSAGNLQAYQIYIVRKPETKQKLMKAAAGQQFVEKAPIILVFCTVPSRSAEKFGEKGAKVYAMQDTCAAVCNAMLAAVELGLGTCWVDVVFDDIAIEALNTPPEHRPVIMLTLGYSGETPPRTPRRELSDLVIDKGI